jgi:hypothetical protein
MRAREWQCLANAGDGLQSVDATVELADCASLSNDADGIDCSASPGTPSSIDANRVECSDNQGIGMRLASGVPGVRNSICRSNESGGLLILGATGTVVADAVRFDLNGGIAGDVQSAAGGVVEQCVVSGSATGIHVGDSSGMGLCTGVRVSDNVVSSCATGIAVDAGGHHLVVHNTASGSATSFAVGADNMFGPIVTSADILTNTNPLANCAP